MSVPDSLNDKCVLAFLFPASLPASAQTSTRNGDSRHDTKFWATALYRVSVEVNPTRAFPLPVLQGHQRCRSLQTQRSNAPYGKSGCTFFGRRISFSRTQHSDGRPIWYSNRLQAALSDILPASADPDVDVGEEPDEQLFGSDATADEELTESEPAAKVRKQPLIAIDCILPPHGRERHDRADDSEFWASHHYSYVGDYFHRNLRSLYEKWLRPDMRILDLMAGSNSHLPDMRFAYVEGHGLIAEDLARNPRLDSYFLLDVNKRLRRDLRPGGITDVSPAVRLPHPSNSLDAVLNCSSIQYAEYPDELLCEAYRVLKPGGLCIVSFSDMHFADKTIAMWHDLLDEERVELVRDCFRAVRVWPAGARSEKDILGPVIDIPDDPEAVEAAARAAAVPLTKAKRRGRKKKRTPREMAQAHMRRRMTRIKLLSMNKHFPVWAYPPWTESHRGFDELEVVRLPVDRRPPTGYERGYERFRLMHFASRRPFFAVVGRKIAPGQGQYYAAPGTDPNALDDEDDEDESDTGGQETNSSDVDLERDTFSDEDADLGSDISLL